MMTTSDFISEYRECFGASAPLPLAVVYTDMPLSEPRNITGCMFKQFHRAYNGETVTFDAESLTCGGGKLYTGLDTKLYPEYQQQYCANPCSGKCPVYNKGDEFIFYRDDERDDYWHCGLNTLDKTDGNPDEIAGGPKKPFCSEAWDAISRYIYTGLQGGSIMKGWMRDENTMITCCNDGTRPVIFKIERIDYE